MENLIQKLEESSGYIRKIIGDVKIDAGIVLGSGLGGLADEIEKPVFIDYHDIPNFPVSTVSGHKGRLVIGELEGKHVLCMQGRFHYYEGWNMDQVVFPVQVMHMLGIENLILTNAAGCVNTAWQPADLMLIRDHIGIFLQCNPMRGKNYEELGPRFFDMSTVYNKELGELALEVAKQQGFELREGVYMYLSGPSFETPHDIKAARILGADAVGMSTVPEVIAASHCSMKVLGISCMTNMGAGILDQPLNHNEVLETGLKVGKRFVGLVKGIVKKI